MAYRNLGFVIAFAAFIGACTPETEAPAPTSAPATPPPAAQAPAPAAASVCAMPDCIRAERGGFIPEGIEYDTDNERFLTGSLAEGSIFEIGEDGSVTAVIEDPDLVSSVGIEVDEERDRLLVTNSDSGVFQGQSKGHAKLGVYNLSTGERLAMVDLGTLVGAGPDASFFANDVTVADDGTIFVTDTMQNVIYRVGTDYRASVFHKFTPTAQGFAVNGLVYGPGNYLLVAEMGAGKIYKVPVDDPAATKEVALAEPVAGADGLTWMGGGRLAAVLNSTSRVVALTSSDDWASAQVADVATFEGQATTGATVGDEFYVVQPHFADQDPPMILRAMF
jgi:sugar lactone lactonase YvrE